MNTDSVNSRFTISPEVTGTITWSADSRTLTFIHPLPFEYFTNYQIVVAAGAVDLYNNPTAGQSFNFRTASRDTDKPEISVKIRGQTIQNNDAINTQPEFEIDITDNIQLDPNTVKVYFNDSLVIYMIKSQSDRLIEITYKTAVLEPGTYSIRIEAADAGGNSTIKAITGLTVSAGPVIVEKLAVYPQNVSATKGQGTQIAYNLSKDADTRIVIYGISGEIAWDARFAAGSNGGRAGYNVVDYDCRSILSSAPLANGIYVGSIIVDGKIINRFKIVIYD
jgi:hypothetical protein